MVLLLLLAVTFWCFGAATAAAGCDADTTDVVGVAAAVVVSFTDFGIPHICDSVVLTTLRLGLAGSHILALSSDDIVVLDGLAARGDTNDCCAFAGILLQILNNNRPTRTENIVKIELILLILTIDTILLFIETTSKLSSFLCYYHANMNSRKKFR